MISWDIVSKAFFYNLIIRKDTTIFIQLQITPYNEIQTPYIYTKQLHKAYKEYVKDNHGKSRCLLNRYMKQS